MRTSILILIIILVALIQIAFAQEITQFYVRASAPSGNIGGDFPAWVVDGEYMTRTELYLGEIFYLVFDLTRYTGTLYVEIREGASLIAAGTVSGGRVYGYPMRIVEPIYEGRVYSYTILVYDRNTGILLGSATVSYVEKYCPDMDIVNVTWDSFVYGSQAQVKVTVRNRGEKGWGYRVEVSSTRGSLQTTSADVVVGAGSAATVTLRVPVTSFQGPTDTMVVRVSCAGGRKYQQQSYSITVVPPRPGPFLISAQPVEARLGEQSSFTIKLRNQGYDAKIESITLSEGSYKIDAPSVVKAGEEASATIYFTPARAGQYNLTVRIKYRSPLNNEVFEDTATIQATVYARLAVEAVDHMGRPVQVSALIDGVRAEERWLLPGTYRVEVPPVVELSPSERLTFAKWETGGTYASMQVTLDTNTVVKAVYNREYRVVVVLSPALPQVEAWVKEGDVFVYNVSQYVETGAGERWALDGFVTSAGQRLGREIRITVSGPLTISAQWHKEYLVTVDCGEARCVSGNAKISQWVREGSTFSLQLAEVDQISERVRWRLEDSPQISLIVTAPTTLRPNYVKEYYVRFGYKIQTAQGVERAYVAYGQWIPQGATVLINADKLAPVNGTDVHYELAGYEVDGVKAARQFTVSAPHDVYVLWDEYYYIKVVTPVSTAVGEGWYKAGTYATVAVRDTAVGFLVYDRFRKWVADDGSEYPNATVRLLVDKPMALTAVWEKDYTQAFSLAGGIALGGIIYWKRDAARELTDTLTGIIRRRKRESPIDIVVIDDKKKAGAGGHDSDETRTRD